jgi:PAS domain S-box-containing protein
MPNRALSLPKVSILVVDDRASDRLVVETILANPLYELVGAASGKEALRRVLERDFAVILLDVLLPDMDGFEVAAILKQRVRSRDTPILFLTADGADVGKLYRGYSVGAVDYLIKPIDRDVLRAKVAIFVELYRKDQRIKEQAEALIEADRRARARELAELREASDKRYRDLAEAMLPVVWTAGADGAVRYFSPRWYETTGQTEDAALGWGWIAAVHPDDSGAREDSWRAALAAGNIWQLECRLRDRDGSYRWYQCRAVPERNEVGEVVGWLGTYTDCDELKRAHGAAEASARRAALLAEVGAALGSTLDDREGLARAARLIVPRFADGCVVELRPEDPDPDDEPPPVVVVHSEPALEARIVTLRRATGAHEWFVDVLGTGRPELLRNVTDDSLRALARDDLHLRRLQELNLQSAISVPLVVRERALGALTFLSTSPGQHFTDADLGLALDLAHRAAIAVDNARLYRGARSAVAVRDEFLSIASHELRTPLTSLQLHLQLLQRQVDAGNGRNVREKLDKAVRQTRRLDKLIGNLLDVSRILAARMTLELEDVDLGQAAREVADRLGEDAARAGCTVAVNIDGPVIGRWDRLRIDQVLTNLVANAIKYAPDGPIEVEVHGNGQHVTLRVTDHGGGIPAEHAQRIFERFERFERPAAGPHPSGLGLGLYIVRHIVEAHGGTIALDSPADGASFRVVLPREGLAEPSQTATMPPAGAPPSA